MAGDTLMDEDTLRVLVERAKIATQNLHQNERRQWDEWLVIGEAIVGGAQYIEQTTGAKRGDGGPRSDAFGQWLCDAELNWMEKGDRSRLMSCMEHLPQIERWRETLSPRDKLRLNNPSSIWRRANADLELVPKTPRAGKTKMQMMQDEIDRLDIAKDQMYARAKKAEDALETARFEGTDGAEIARLNAELATATTAIKNLVDQIEAAPDSVLLTTGDTDAGADDTPAPPPAGDWWDQTPETIAAFVSADLEGASAFCQAIAREVTRVDKVAAAAAKKVAAAERRRRGRETMAT